MAQKSNKKKNVIKNTVRSTLNGTILTKKNVRNHFPFLLFIAVLGLLYITNGYYAERMHRHKKELTEERKQIVSILESEKSRMSKSTKQSVLVEKLSDQGLKEAVSGVKKIIVKREENGNNGEE
ncbi:MAG: hypothetical protein LBH92_05690 [Bacteroidales bacterium]|jgi:hypothetical protein|nr:hypothetical protein [Bacteroidales bacterium]